MRISKMHKLVGACLSAALLTACGGNGGVSSSTPVSVVPQTAPLPAVPDANLPQPLRSQSAYGQFASHRVRKNVAMESVLYSFGVAPDGEEPLAGLTNVGGTLYGTTFYGGGGSGCTGGYIYGCGAVFKITTSGTESVLRGFAGGNDGKYPEAGLTNVGGTLYGTTTQGGSGSCADGVSCGTVFSITTAGAYRQLYSFAGGSDGSWPQAGLTNVNGTLYGTTVHDGANGFGTVFKITKRGRESVLYSFADGSDGAFPEAGLTNVGGVLYGTTEKGGVSDLGTVFMITTSGAESVIYSFAGGSDGQYPDADLTNVGGVLYGTTYEGGFPEDYGTVFKVTTSGSESVLYTFPGGRDGGDPNGLTSVGETLYGTTFGGGAHGWGTLFKITKRGTYRRLYSFAGGSDGGEPVAAPTNVGGVLYGTTFQGGANGNGTVFSLTP